MKKQHLFEYRLFSAVFETQQTKNDVIMDLTFTALERFCAIVLSCQFFFANLFIANKYIQNNSNLQVQKNYKINYSMKERHLEKK